MVDYDGAGIPIREPANQRREILITIDPSGAVTVISLLQPWVVLSMLDIAHKSVMDQVCPTPAVSIASTQAGVATRMPAIGRKVS